MELYIGLLSSVLFMNLCSGFELSAPTSDGCERALNSEGCFYDVYCLNVISNYPIYSYIANGNNQDYIHYDEEGEMHINSCRIKKFFIEHQQYYSIRLIYKVTKLTTAEIPESGDSRIYQLIYHLDLSNNGYTFTPILKGMPNLFSLDLSKNSLTVAKLSNALPLTNLRELNLSFNTINTIEISEESYKTLRTLNMSHNYLVTIPDAIFDDFSQLTTLDLSHNFIDVLGILIFEGLKNLHTLLMSHNRITDINDSLVRFTHLQTLDFSHNRLKHIKFRDFDKLYEMKNLNLSYNSILSIEDFVFHSMVSLQLVRLDNNSLQEISPSSFANNTFLEYVDLSKNIIKTLPRNLFDGKNISFFDISENYLEGSLLRGTFKGMNRIVELDLSNQKLTAIEDFAFSGLESLNSLLLNNNKLQSLSYKSFRNLTKLSILDLSDNLLSNLNFDTSDLINLRSFLLRNNTINHIPNDYFHGLLSLRFLDLSNNKITKLNPNSFVSLRDLINLDVSGNALNGTLETHTFKGLVSLPVLYIYCTQLEIIQNETFTGMTELKTLNMSHGSIIELQYNAFIGVSAVEIIDISNNNLTNISVNMTDLTNLKELYLSHNLLKSLNGNEFIGHISLNKLDLAHNNLKSVNEEALDNLRDLRYLDMSYNAEMVINVSTISHSKIISELILSGLRCEIEFTAVTESSIIKLDLSNSSITNIKRLNLKTLTNIRKLILSYNTIQRVETGAFPKNVEELDLSFNLITFVQPGVFIDVYYLRYLNLSHNHLTTISYGVFSRLVFLETIDLSYNYIKSLESERFYEVRSLRELIVDYNNIDFISNEEFVGTSLNKLSIGGNPIPCRIISALKKQYLQYQITAINEDYSYSENVAGIACVNEDDRTVPKRNQSIIHDNQQILSDIKDILQHIATKNNTHDNINTFNSKFTNYLDRITQEVGKITNIPNITQEINKLSNFYNITLSTLISHSSKKIEESSNSTNELLVKILKSLNHSRPVIQNYPKSTNVTQFDNLIEYINNVKKELKDSLSEEKTNILAEVAKKINDATPYVVVTSTHKAISEKYSTDHKSVGTDRSTTRFTDVCVGLILLILVCFVLYKLYKSRKFIRARHSYSTRQLPGAMESPDL